MELERLVSSTSVLPSCRAKRLDVVGVGRFGQVMPRAELDGFHRRGNAGKAGQHHDAHLRAVRVQGAHAGQAVGFALELEVLPPRTAACARPAALPCGRCPRRAAPGNRGARTSAPACGQTLRRLPRSAAGGQCPWSSESVSCRVMAASESVMVTSAPPSGGGCVPPRCRPGCAPRSSTGNSPRPPRPPFADW